jgi:stage II sporulation protein R
MKEKLYGIFCEHPKKVALLIAVAAGLVGTLLFAYCSGIAAEAKAQQEIAKEVLRFHVLANSDSEEDQALKLQVRDAILDYMKEELPADADLEETETWVQDHLEQIENVGRQTVIDEGFEYGVNAELTNCYFPEKSYGDMTFPCGTYRALRISIGQAKGHNWWCVLYPNLCFTDAVHAVVPEDEKEKIRAVLSEEDYELLTDGSQFHVKWYLSGRK